MVNRMQFYHDSRDPSYRNPTGAQPCGAPVQICLRIIEGSTPDTVLLRLWDGTECFVPMLPTEMDAMLYTATFILPETPCLLWYDFQIWEHGQFYWYGNAEDCLGGVGALVYGQARSFQITVYDAAFMAPDWLDQTIVYQIFPDRFARNNTQPMPPIEGRTYHTQWEEAPTLQIDPSTGDNVAHDFFGGNLRGIQEKLPYIASLGVGALYINPIFIAGTNHRFDTMDWLQVDPCLGMEEDFTALCTTANALGIRILLDGVFSHAGHTHPFFQNAQSDCASPYRNWFHFEQWPHQYKSWWGFRTLPEINKSEPGVIDYFLTGKNAVVKKWLQAGAAGWRIDVADELPMPYLQAMRKAIKHAWPDRFIVGEVWEDASNKISYGQMRCYCLGDTLDSVMNYPLRDAAIAFLLSTIDAYTFKRKMDSLYENYPLPFTKGLLNVLSSHDRPRILNTLAENDGSTLPIEQRANLQLTGDQLAVGKARVRLMLQLIVAMPGMPCVYYGDEVGMQGASDPFNRQTFPWEHMDDELLAFFAETLTARKSNAVLAEGALRIEALQPSVIAIHRWMDGCIHSTIINRSSERVQITCRGKIIRMKALSCCYFL